MVSTPCMDLGFPQTEAIERVVSMKARAAIV